MAELFLTLVRILFPLDPVARLREVTRHYLRELVDRLEDDTCLHELLADHHARALFEAEIAAAEDGIHMLIHERARFQRVVVLHDNLERLAHSRAERLQRDLSENPLRLDASHQASFLRLASSRRDGGGCAPPRGPPFLTHFSQLTPLA